MISKNTKRKINGSPFLQIGKTRIQRGERKKFYLDVACLYDYTELQIPIEVIRGKEDGPILFVSAAIHGDEINGVEIIKKLLRKITIKKLRGTLIAVPVVNIFGFNNRSRYLPDRRDLNRCFPGSQNGSLGSRLANILISEIVTKCTHGIDLHTGAIHRSNLPQIRACLDDSETKQLASCFGAPVMLHSQLKDGSLREAARKRKVRTLLFEGGEALRFEPDVIRVGFQGCLAVMTDIGMLPPAKSTSRSLSRKVFEAKSSYWIRANHSGSFRALKKLGDYIKRGETFAIISDLFGCEPYEVKALESGILIGMSTIPLVNQGDAMAHIATFTDSSKVKKAIELLDRSVDSV